MSHLPPLSPSDEPLSSELLRNIQFRDIKVIAALSLWCGWAVHKSKLFHLVAADGTSMEIPTNSNLNVNVFRSKIRTILRHRDLSITTPPLVMVGAIIDTFKVDKSHATLLRKLANEVKPVSNGKVSAAPFAPTTAEKYPVSKLPTAEDTMTIDPTVRKITKVEPWSAHSRTNRNGVTQTYPSKAVMERTWSDGVIDYACQWEGCSYTHESPQSTAHHFAAHRRGSGKDLQAPSDGVDPTWTPQKRARVARLRTEIDGALDAAHAEGIDFTVVDEAQWIAEWIIEHRVEPLSSEGGGAERELTAEELLDRIAALASRGRTPMLRQQIDSLNAAVEGYMSQLDEANQKTAAAEAKALKAQNSLRTFRDLIVEETGEEDDQSNPALDQ